MFKPIMRMGLAALLAMATLPAVAGVINGGSLLSNSDANQLESWLGTGDLNFTNIWSGSSGATATSWHSAVDGITTGTISIYDITYNEQNYLIGGYTTRDWAPYGYQQNDGEFIFNLTSGVMQGYGHSPQFGTFSSSSYFATFGGGHDIFGGINYIGYQYYETYSGSAHPGFTYGEYLNSNIITGGSSITYFTVNALETYTFTKVPEPGALLLLGIGLVGLGIIRHKRAGWN